MAAARGERSARAWLRALDSGECSSVELTGWAIDRIEAVNPTLNAVTAIDPERSIAEARRADRRRAGNEKGALLGLPITVKDSLDVAGWRTSFGSFAAPEAPARADASAVRRLRRHGAVVVAKTNLPECSSAAETDNARFGATNNPWDPGRTAGGSSGGEAALLGADASIVGIGVDSGCSIRLPSHYCGCVGLRPTAGRVPETGLRPPTRATGLLDMSCVGPMARRVEDLELLLPLIGGSDGIDPFVPPMPPPAPADRETPLRVAHYATDPLTTPSVATARAVRAAAAAIGSSEEVEPADASAATELFFASLAADGGAHLRRAVAAANGRHTRQFERLLEDLQVASQRPGADPFRCLRRFYALRAAVRSFVGRYDVVVCPVAPGPAPPHGEAPGDAGAAAGYGWLNFASTYAIAGLPVAVVPAGEEDGLPVGVQIVAPAYREDLALLAAARVESQLGGFRPAAVTRRPPGTRAGPGP